MEKKLQKMGNTAYFLMHQEDVVRYDLDVGDHYDIKISGIGTITVELKLYGTSRVFQIRKFIFNKYPKLTKNKIYDIELVGIKPVSEASKVGKMSDIKSIKQRLAKVESKVKNIESKFGVQDGSKS